MTTLLLLIALVGAPAVTPEFRPGVERGFFPLGWSSRGDFAFGWYSESTVGSHSCVLSLVVQDLSNDTPLWSLEKKWEQSLDGKRKDKCPGSAAAAWAEVAENATKKLAGLDVKPWRGALTPRALPFTSMSERIDVAISHADQGFSFTAKSSTRGEKVVGRDQANACEQPAVKGYFRNPDGSVLAVVVEWSSPQAFCPAFQVLGCSLTGFTRP